MQITTKKKTLLQGLLVLSVAIVLIASTVSIAVEAGSSKKGEHHLTYVPTLKWIPKPPKIENAEAKTEAKMKSYTEKIPHSKATFDMVPIPGGEFIMGSPANEPDRKKSEGPQRRVKIDPFWMGQCEVTWNEYDQWCTDVNKKFRKHKKIGPDTFSMSADAVTGPTPAYCDMSMGMGKRGYPAVCMTQLAAKVYCKWLSAMTGHYYRLPTEAEWEYACRAGSKTAYGFGDEPDEKLDEYAWYFDNSDDQYQKVGKKKPNAWGLHDMHGNVAEWVLDQFTEDGYPKSKTQLLDNPLNLPKELYPRVVRGGHWDSDPEDLRSAARLGSNDQWKENDSQIPQSIWYHTDAYFVGFRVVRPLVRPSIEKSMDYEPDYEVIKEYKEIDRKL